MSLARAVTILSIGLIVLVVVVLAIAGALGAGSQRDTCESIHWRGAQCEALRGGPR